RSATRELLDEILVGAVEPSERFGGDQRHHPKRATACSQWHDQRRAEPHLPKQPKMLIVDGALHEHLVRYVFVELRDPGPDHSADTPIGARRVAVVAPEALCQQQLLW